MELGDRVAPRKGQTPVISMGASRYGQYAGFNRQKWPARRKDRQVLGMWRVGSELCDGNEALMNRKRLIHMYPSQEKTIHGRRKTKIEILASEIDSQSFS